MDRKFELGTRNLGEAAKKALPLLRDWRGFQPENRVVDELLLGVSHAISSSAGNAEDKIRAGSDWLLEHLPGWKKQKGDEENVVELRRELDGITFDAMHERATACASFCSDELMAMTNDARHQTAQQLASAWGLATRVTGHIMERLHRGENPTA